MKRVKEPILETERLILRPLTQEDAEACFVWQSDPDVNKFMSYPLITDMAQTGEWIASLQDEPYEYNWGFVFKENNLLIGSGCIGPDARMKGYWGFGYNIRKDYWNRGLTTEATKAMIHFAHDELGIKKICSHHAVENPASGRVMEKCGLAFDHYDTYTKSDGSAVFKAKSYSVILK